MYTLLTLFFISLSCVILMIGRKVMLVRSGHIVVEESIPHPFIPDIDKAKLQTLHGLKKLLHLTTFVTLRAYVKISNVIKKGYSEAKIKIQNLNRKNHIDNLSSRKEVSKFLKVITNYKRKISIMKNRIDEEEKKE